MVFVLKIDTKEGIRPKREGDSTSGVSRLNRKFQYHYSHKVFVIFWQGKEKRTHGLKF